VDPLRLRSQAAAHKLWFSAYGRSYALIIWADRTILNSILSIVKGHVSSDSEQHLYAIGFFPARDFQTKPKQLLDHFYPCRCHQPKKIQLIEGNIKSLKVFTVPFKVEDEILYGPPPHCSLGVG
jgi:hypothetical protein